MKNEEQEQSDKEIRVEMIRANRSILENINKQFLLHQKALMLLQQDRKEVLERLRELGDLNVKNE
jgi:hypothetical protein